MAPSVRLPLVAPSLPWLCDSTLPSAASELPLTTLLVVPHLAIDVPLLLRPGTVEFGSEFDAQQVCLDPIGGARSGRFDVRR